MNAYSHSVVRREFVHTILPMGVRSESRIAAIEGRWPTGGEQEQ